jgi:DNA repair protein RadC
LKKIKGLGAVKAGEIIACIELGKRLLKEKTPLKALSPQDIFDSMKDIRGLKKEHFIAIYLDTKNQEITREIISIGTLNASLVHPREVFEPAIRHLASSIILVHNHPSGDPTPSEEDMVTTKRFVEAGSILGISIFDHMIVTENKYISLRKEEVI